MQESIQNAIERYYSHLMEDKYLRQYIEESVGKSVEEIFPAVAENDFHVNCITKGIAAILKFEMAVLKSDERPCTRTYILVYYFFGSEAKCFL